MTLSIIAFILLFGPLVWELVDDKQGDQNKKVDVLLRIAIGFFAAFVAWFFDDRSFIAAFAFSMAIHFMFFDYAIVMILNRTVYEKKVDWFTYTGKGLIDNLKFWKDMKPWTKLAVRAGCLVVAMTLYFVI